MKIDRYYSPRYVCPVADIYVSSDDHSYSDGVCHICGDKDESTFTHAVRVTGQYNRPSWSEYLFKGMRKIYIRGERNGVS